jgi:hypothetical protein
VIANLSAQGFCTYFSGGWNWLDFLVAAESCLGFVLVALHVDGNSFSALRSLKALRVLRPLRTLTRFPRLQMVILALGNTLAALVQITVVLCVYMFMLSVVVVNVWSGGLRYRCAATSMGVVIDPDIPESELMICHPDVNPVEGGDDDDTAEEGPLCFPEVPPSRTSHHCAHDEQCIEYGNPGNGYIGFDDVAISFHTIFRIVTLDEWAQVLFWTQRAFGEQVLWLFILVVVTGACILTNLVIATILAAFTDALDRAEAMQAEEQENKSRSSGSADDQSPEALPLEDEAPKGLPTNSDDAGAGAEDGRAGANAGTASDADAIVDAFAIDPPPLPPLHRRNRHTSLGFDDDVEGDTCSIRANMCCAINADPFCCDPADGMWQKAQYPANANHRRHANRPVEVFEDLEYHLNVSTLKRETGSITELEESKSFEPEPPTPLAKLGLGVAQNAAPDSIAIDVEADEDTEPEVIRCGNSKMRRLPSRHGEISEAILQEVAYKQSREKLPASPVHLLKFYCLNGVPIAQWRVAVQSDTSVFGASMNLCIIVNTLVLGMDDAHTSPQEEQVLFFANLVLTGVFSVEALVKMIVLGLHGYFANVANAFDCCVVAMSLFELIVVLGNGTTGSSTYGALRIFRIVRLMRLARGSAKFKFVQDVFDGMVASFLAVWPILLLLLLFLFILTLLAMQLFGTMLPVERTRFDSFYWAWVSVFLCLLGEDWSIVANLVMREQHDAAMAFFASIILFGQLCLLNMVLAVLLDNSQKTLRVQICHERMSGLVRRITIMVWKRAAFHHWAALYAHPDVQTARRTTLRIANSGHTPAGVCDAASKAAGRAAEVVTRGLRAVRTPGHTAADVAGRVGSTITHAAEAAKTTAGQGLSKVMATAERLASMKSASMTGTMEENYVAGQSTTANTLIFQHVVHGPGDKKPIIRSKITRMQRILGDIPDEEEEDNLVSSGHVQIDCARYLCRSKLWQRFILCLVLVGCAVEIGEQLYTTNLWWRLVDIISAGLLAIEMIVDSVAHGFIKANGQSDPFLHSAWNKLNVFVVLAIFGYRCTEPRNPLIVPFEPLAVLFAVLRGLRPLRFCGHMKGVQKILSALVKSLSSLSALLCFMIVLWMGWAILGIQLFKGSFGACTDPEFPPGKPRWGILDEDVGEGAALSETYRVFPCEWGQVPSLWAWNNATGSPLGQHEWQGADHDFDNFLRATFSVFITSSLTSVGPIFYHAVDSVGEQRQPIENNSPLAFWYFFFAMIMFGVYMVQMFVNFVFASFIEHQFEGPGGVLMSDEERVIQDTNVMVRGMKLPPHLNMPGKRTFRRVCYLIATHHFFQPAVDVVVFINLAVEATRSHGQGSDIARFQDAVNVWLTFFFSVEAYLKIKAFGFLPYFWSRWNVFDLVVTVFAATDAFQVAASCSDKPQMRAIRSLRVFRLVGVLARNPGLAKLNRAVMHPIGLILNVCAVVIICLFIYGAIGVQLFGVVGHVQHDLNSAHVTEFAHFNDLYHAMVLLFILITGERWPEVRHGIAHCAVMPTYCPVD